MPEYQFADKGGKIISVEYDKNNYFSADQVLSSLESVFSKFPFPAYVEQVEEYDDVFHVTFPEGNDGIGDVFICAKGTTPGGRSGLKDEQRIQPKAKYLNYVFERGEEGKKAIFLGVYNRDGETILCTWKVMASAAASPETPISKQIKITSIAKAMREGFIQQDKGKGEYACAFRPEFFYFYLRNCEWLHMGNVSELAEHTEPEGFGDIEDVGSENGFEEVNFCTGIKIKYPRNRIIFGAPGTGKSFTLNKEAKKLLADGGHEERVTFHPDYSYANFVGTYKPVMVSGTADTVSGMDKDVVSVLSDKTKTAQEKYDLLYERFKDDGLTRLPILLGLYTDEVFKTRKQDGTDAVGDNSVERNHGKALRPYVALPSDVKAKEEIAYEYVPGPFMRVLAKALKSAMTDNPKPHLLIIEEINRANVAAVFGDVFQLLDRASTNDSEYEIATTNEMRIYLAKELGVDKSVVETIKIPDNMFIWATMNSADQGVFPMDTAFKRRWDFTYLGIDDSEKDLIEKTVVLGSGKTKHKVEWNKLRKAINNFLAKEKINEDKQLGPYFIARNIVVPEEGTEIDNEKFIHTFKSKVIMYLFEDAAKQKRPKLFEGCFENSSRYSEICREFEKKGVGIFHHDIQLEAEPEDLTSASPAGNE
jgi:MoxR-like ATPase